MSMRTTPATTTYKPFFAIALVALLLFASPIEHKYDKWFRFFSLKLIPEGLDIPSAYDKKIYFYLSNIASFVTAALALFWIRISRRAFFIERSSVFLWAVFICAFISIVLSPFANYPLPYIRLLQLLTPVLLFSFLASAEQKWTATYWILAAFVCAALFQTAIAIAQYFLQHPLGLRILGEVQFIPGNGSTPGFPVTDGHRWIFDAIFHKIAPFDYLARAAGTLPHPNVLGGFLAISLLASYPRALQWDKWRPWILASIPFQFFALAMTFSRSALFAFALGNLIWYTLLRHDKVLRGKPIRKLAATVASSVFLSFILLWEQYLRRGGVVSYTEISQAADSHRIALQNIACKMIEKNPFFGVGYSRYATAMSEFAPKDLPLCELTGTHNIYLYLATECGLLSLFFFLLFIATLIRAALRSQITAMTAALLSMFVALLFIGLFDFYPILFQQGKLLFFCIAGLLASHANFVKKPTALEANP
jgi:O-antigen ligase